MKLFNYKTFKNSDNVSKILFYISFDFVSLIVMFSCYKWRQKSGNRLLENRKVNYFVSRSRKSSNIIWRCRLSFPFPSMTGKIIHFTNLFLFHNRCLILTLGSYTSSLIFLIFIPEVEGVWSSSGTLLYVCCYWTYTG